MQSCKAAQRQGAGAPGPWHENFEPALRKTGKTAPHGKKASARWGRLCPKAAGTWATPWRSPRWANRRKSSSPRRLPAEKRQAAPARAPRATRPRRRRARQRRPARVCWAGCALCWPSALLCWQRPLWCFPICSTPPNLWPRQRRPWPAATQRRWNSWCSPQRG